jgi:hypothetical protein
MPNMWEHNAIHKRKGVPNMQTNPMTTTVSEPVVTGKDMLKLLETAQEFLLESLDAYDPKMDTPSDVAALDEIDKEAFFTDKIQYAWIIDVVDKIALAVERGIAKPTIDTFCPDCKEPFGYSERRKKFFCTSCGQLLERV